MVNTTNSFSNLLKFRSIHFVSSFTSLEFCGIYRVLPMAVTFTKNKQTTQVQCFRILNLLAHAQMEEIDLGSQCGGHGICGKDRILVNSTGSNDISPFTDAEKEHLTSEELQSGWRLGCQSWPQADNLEICVTVPVRN
jgi:ferredoxin